MKKKIVLLVIVILLILGGGIFLGGYLYITQVPKENSDEYAWISIPGTGIDAPVLQSAEDNSFYTTHNAEGAEDPDGAIYTENYNSRTFDDPITVVYGKNKADGSMFGGLYQYKDNVYMKEHNLIYVSVGDITYKYQIFAAYQSDSRHIMERFDSGKSKGNMKAYLKSILENRTMGDQIDESVKVTEDSKILTLSTHDDSDEQARFLVQAVLVEKMEKTEKNVEVGK